MADQRLSYEEISEPGERVCHLFQNDVYYAHLSIYYFALQFCRDKTVLDAGSGAGYGSAYLAEHGAASVIAFDIEEKAVEFSRQHFPTSNLTYHVMSIEQIKGFPANSFDVVFTSNALEHVPNVSPFFRSSWELLKPNGTLIVAVPPVVNDLQRKANLANPYHLNIWTPRQWFYVISCFFSDVQPYIHRFEKPGLRLDFTNTPNETRVNETDFTFEPISLEDYYSHETLTVLFVAKQPRSEREIPAPNSQLRFVDKSFTRRWVLSHMPVIRQTKQAWNILRQDGVVVLIRRMRLYLRKRLSGMRP